jgi:hypothetical protein
VWLQAVDSGADGAARDWVSIYDECGRILYQEVSCSREGGVRFRRGAYCRAAVLAVEAFACMGALLPP